VCGYDARALIRDPATDGDTRWMAAEALGMIVGQKFEQPDPITAALTWADRYDH
jgi:hypothetical protein